MRWRSTRKDLPTTVYERCRSREGAVPPIPKEDTVGRMCRSLTLGSMLQVWDDWDLSLICERPMQGKTHQGSVGARPTAHGSGGEARPRA